MGLLRIPLCFMVQLETKPLEGTLIGYWKSLKFLVLRSQTIPGSAIILGGVSFLKFEAENQAFPGKAEGRAECWRLNPLRGCLTVIRN